MADHELVDFDMASPDKMCADSVELNMRKFYVVYQNRISEKLYRNFAFEKFDKVSRILDDECPFQLSWSHYVKLMRRK